MTQTPNERRSKSTLRRVFELLAAFVGRLERQRRPHPEVIEMAGFAVDRFMEMAYAAGALDSCLEATKLGMVLTEMLQETRPQAESKALLHGGWSSLEAAFARDAARLPELGADAPGLAPGAAAPRTPAGPPAGRPVGQALAPGAARPAPPTGTGTAPPAGAPRPAPFTGALEDGLPEDAGDGAFAYLGTQGFPFDSELTGIFLTEAGEQVPQVERLLLALESNPERQEGIHDLFRLLHTIKGNAGFLGLREFIRLVHSMEQYLEPFRNRSAPARGFAAGLMLEGSDALRQLLANLQRRCDLLTAVESDARFEAVPWQDLTGRFQTATPH